MRVIAGKARGMRLECPPGDDVRPATDMARQALFNILREYVSGTTVLDLFAGAEGACSTADDHAPSLLGIVSIGLE